MGTMADLILKVVQFLMGERKRLNSAKREQLDRVADYLERISDGLKDAAEKFTRSDRPWSETREAAYQVHQLLSIVTEVLDNDALSIKLRNELDCAVSADRKLLGGSKERRVVDAITLRPEEHMFGDWDANPVRRYSKKQLKQILADEVRKLEEASGLFRAVAHELRARTI